MAIALGMDSVEKKSEVKTPVFSFDWTFPVWQIIPALIALGGLIVYINTIRNNVDTLTLDVVALKARTIEYDALRADVRVINNQVSRLERMLERLLERRAFNGELNNILPGAGGDPPIESQQ